MGIVFWEKGLTPLNYKMINHNTRNSEILLMLGPEGGFSFQEIEKAEEAGFAVASLGPRILKAETAPIAACAIIQYLFGDMGE
jgi:16S rRNA (uracil1498-N3)-methyltransferase